MGDRRSFARRSDRPFDPGGVRVRVVSGRDREPRRVLAAARRGRDHSGSTDASDIATQSGYGPHLTIFAPGIRIQGAGSASDTAEFSGDGDSYAAPFVAGVAALYLQQHPQATPAEVKAAILAAATRDLVQNAGAAPSLLLHVI